MNTTATRAARVTVQLDAEAEAALDRAARGAMLSRPNFLRYALAKLLKDAGTLRAATAGAGR